MEGPVSANYHAVYKWQPPPKPTSLVILNSEDENGLLSDLSVEREDLIFLHSLFALWPYWEAGSPPVALKVLISVPVKGCSFPWGLAWLPEISTFKSPMTTALPALEPELRELEAEP